MSIPKRNRQLTVPFRNGCVVLRDVIVSQKRHEH